MSYYVADVNGWVGDLSSTNGLAELTAHIEQGGDSRAKALLQRGMATVTPELLASLRSVPAAKSRDVQATLDELIRLVDKCEEVVIISDGTSDEDATEEDTSSYTTIAGTDARDARTKKAKLTNDYQAALLQLYDEWSKALVDSLPAEPTKAQVTAALNERLPQYGSGMRQLGADYIAQAVQMGAKADAKADKELAKLIAERVKSNDEYINDSLLPDIKAKIMAHMDEQAHFARRDYQFDLPALLGAFATMRVRVGSYSGQAWYGIFAGAMLQGRRETASDKAEGRPPKRVRWVLDPTAQHCTERPGYFGCPDLAHEYPSWDDLATVPGGQVACIMNCRCHIEVEEEDGWQWV